MDRKTQKEEDREGHQDTEEDSETWIQGDRQGDMESRRQRGRQGYRQTDRKTQRVGDRDGDKDTGDRQTGKEMRQKETWRHADNRRQKKSKKITKNLCSFLVITHSTLSFFFLVFIADLVFLYNQVCFLVQQ